MKSSISLHDGRVGCARHGQRHLFAENRQSVLDQFKCDGIDMNLHLASSFVAVNQNVAHRHRDARSNREERPPSRRTLQ